MQEPKVPINVFEERKEAMFKSMESCQIQYGFSEPHLIFLSDFSELKVQCLYTDNVNVLT